MKKGFIFLLFLTVCMISYSQGLKGVMIGDYGLTSPLWGENEIQTTLLGLDGTITVEKYDHIIRNIKFTFQEQRVFNQSKADYLAESLMKEFENIKLEKLSNDNWVTLSNGKKISIHVFIQPGDKPNPNYAGTYYPGEVEIYDAKFFQQYNDKKHLNDNNDF